MNASAVSANEANRLAALRRYRILDTLPEQAYDDATLLAVQVSDAPIALVTLVDQDREWFKSRIGVSHAELPRYGSFCGVAIQTPERPLIIEDVAKDPRFADNLLVKRPPYVRFYAGAPLVTADGFGLGTVCVMDRIPRAMNGRQTEALIAIARQVVAQLEMRWLIADLRDEGKILQRSHQMLEKHRSTLKAANAALRQQSTTDVLTGLCNRRAFVEHLESLTATASTQGKSLAMVMLDIDHFKLFNDEFGHPAGDEILTQVAAVLKNGARKNDIVARYGGEEFAILCPGVTESEASMLANRMCKLVSSNPWRDKTITVSAGVASFVPGVSCDTTLIASADQALYRAKSSGRNRVAAYSHIVDTVPLVAQGRG